MPLPRLSVRYNDAVEEHGDVLAALIATSVRAPDAVRRAAARRALTTFDALRLQALALDDALRAIGAIARAGRDTGKVRRTLREIVRDQDRIAAGACESTRGPEEEAGR